ncbi:MAG: arginase family protein [Hyphomicrobiaceae bacterium]|nr:arginase family protein [Hyphomicrobiaceae bacterium]
MKLALIYAYWPNQPFEITWCDLPWAVRDAGLTKRLRDEGYEVRESILSSAEVYPEELRSGFILASEIASEIRKAYMHGELPVTLCGSCLLASLANITALGGLNTRVVWLDSHPDLNTPETTKSGLFEGMALAASAGFAFYGMVREHAKLATPVSLDNVILYGVKEVDPAEQALIDMHNIPIAKSASDISELLNTKLKATYVHIDMDVHDRRAVHTGAVSVPDGPSVNIVRQVLSNIKNVSALSITGFDPKVSDAVKISRIAVEHVLNIADTTFKNDI